MRIPFNKMYKTRLQLGLRREHQDRVCERNPEEIPGIGIKFPNIRLPFFRNAYRCKKEEKKDL